MAEENAVNEEERQFAIERLYIKDLSFESPNAPALFLEEWQPEVGIDLNVDAPKLDDNHYDVTLTVTVTVKVGEKVAYIAEVKQAGIFLIDKFPEEEIAQILGAFCPGTLYPYAREVITDLAQRGGFPPLYLAPINFDMMFAQQQAEAANEQATH